MRSVGIVCEYNPFHNGHKKQIDFLRKQGFDCIVCVMSGNFTQRGEIAIADKYTRAKSAVACGADLVLELPFPYSSLSAEGFAIAGVHILNSIGVSTISFGSESNDVPTLNDAANILLSDEFANEYATAQKTSCTGSAKAYFDTLGKMMDKDVSPLSNDILAISYIQAIKKLNADMDIFPIKRDGLNYNDTSLRENTLPSASAIREAVRLSPNEFDKSISHFVPQQCLNTLIESQNQNLFPITDDSVDNEILSFFKIMTPSEIINRAIQKSRGGEFIAEDGCGICERLCKMAKSAKSYPEFLELSYNSKYTNARVRRVILYSFFGITNKLSSELPEYTTLLAANKIGCDYLSALRKTNSFPIVTKPADAPTSTPLFEISSLADSFYARAMSKELDNNFFVKHSPEIVK